MFLVVGLGNPGPEYQNHRHNVGFVVVDEIGRAMGSPDFKSKFGGAFARASLDGQDVGLLKPQAYMNLSGDCVQRAAAFFKVLPTSIVVVHDELDLRWGDVRIKMGGGHAGHNGLRSIVQSLGSADFSRVRLGIGKPPPDFGGGSARWVLSDFAAVERAELPAVVARSADAVRRIVRDGVTSAMNIVNVKSAAH